MKYQLVITDEIWSQNPEYANDVSIMFEDFDKAVEIGKEFVEQGLIMIIHTIKE